MDNKYADLIATIMEETQCVSTTDDAQLLAYAQELAEGVTPERDAEIAEALPVPYQKKVPARAQIDGDELTIPRCIYATASKVGDTPWRTSTKGPRMGREKMDCAVGVHTDLEIGDVTIIKAVILWRRSR